MDTAFNLHGPLIKTLLFCGILSGMIYITTDVVAGLLRPGYNFVTTTANLLVAHDSPTRSFVLPLNIVAHLLLLAFAVGTWLVSGTNWGFKVMACIVGMNAILSLMAGLAFPWHPDDSMTTNANKANLALMASSVVLLFLALVIGIFANQGWMRSFTIGVIAIFALLAVYSFLRTRFASGAPLPPLIGVQERTMFYGELLWLALQALVLMKA